ncbi:endonuclease III domain-containing protein [Kiritimatiella glycovorans]|uniref:3-methyladenine DNA glycosylase n=1 Tax=Kiritimatiella glycovorans TaxID=1307763 RepID=A0A0G3EKD1_9BACT|nr:endonuclease III domain-containing protein [Kiritimatiella glycovorans]AKJ64634.1 3-methyladenine DNA glycosylase [Kiritimatiella glycovorans]
MDAMEIYEALYRRWGAQHWWPAESGFEVMVGAILTQNTNWRNVERAIARLREAGVLDARAIDRMPAPELAGLIRPAGYFNVKADRLKAFVRFFIESYGGSLDRMFAESTGALREQLLAVRGVGAETADSMLLYAGNRPVFVIDAYTRRVLLRHGACREKASYDDLAQWFTGQLPRDPALFNEFHALLVRVGKEYCRRTPRCEDCPLTTPAA